MRNVYTDFSDEPYCVTQLRNALNRSALLPKTEKPDIAELLTKMAQTPKTFYDIPSWNETGEQDGN